MGKDVPNAGHELMINGFQATLYFGVETSPVGAFHIAEKVPRQVGLNIEAACHNNDPISFLAAVNSNNNALVWWIRCKLKIDVLKSPNESPAQYFIRHWRLHL